MFFDEKLKYMSHLSIFGEVGIMAKRDKISAKLNNKVIDVMFLGNSYKHAGDIYRVLKKEKETIAHSRDIVWLNKFVENESSITYNKYSNEEVEEKKSKKKSIHVEKISKGT